MQSLSIIEQPIWSEIIESCREKIIEKFPEYGNSWVNLNKDQFWMERLAGEFNELFETKISTEDKMKETLDIINICAMYYTNLKLKLDEEKT